MFVLDVKVELLTAIDNKGRESDAHRLRQNLILMSSPRHRKDAFFEALGLKNDQEELDLSLSHSLRSFPSSILPSKRHHKLQVSCSAH